MIGQLTLISHNFQIVEGVHLTGEKIYLNAVVCVCLSIISKAIANAITNLELSFLLETPKNSFSCIVIFFESKCFSLSLSNKMQPFKIIKIIQFITV